MNITTLTEPTVEPVTLAEVWEHLNLTPEGSPLEHFDDAKLTRLITSARKECENITHRAFVKQKVRLSIGQASARWPFATLSYGYTGIELKRPPILELLAVSYLDTDGARSTIDPADYSLSDDEPAHLIFASGYLPSSIGYRQDALRIDYWAGYTPIGSPEDDFVSNVPQDIKQAIFLSIELQYEAMTPQQREAMTNARNWLLAPYTVQVLA